MSYTASVALFVRKAALTVSSVPQAIGSAFKLTPTELRVLLAIVEVGGVPDVAIACGVADTTIRTHVGRLFEKMGVARQADLVKLMWCAFAGDLPGLLIGRSIQAAGACTFAVLSRAIARDLFDGQALAKTMASITIATAAAPGFSPLVGQRA